jgi:hypothetical protein
VASNFDHDWWDLMNELYKMYHDKGRVDATKFCSVRILDVWVSWNDASSFESKRLGLICDDTCSGGREAIFVRAVTDYPELIGPHGFYKFCVVRVTVDGIGGPSFFQLSVCSDGFLDGVWWRLAFHWGVLLANTGECGLITFGWVMRYGCMV